MRVKPTGLWLHGDFLKLWAGETISVFGSLVGQTAMSFTAVLVLHANALDIGLLTAAHLVPDVLFGLVAGVWVDRLPRRPLMIAADIGRFALLVTIPLAYAFDALTIGQLFVVAFGTGAFEILFDVSYQAYLPTLVEMENILEGNSKMASSSAVAEVAGFGISGWMVQLLTGPYAVLADAFSFLASAAALFVIRKPEPEPKAVENREGVRKEIVESGRAIVHDPILRANVVAHALSGFSFRMYGAVFLLYTTGELGFHPGVLGLVWGVGGATVVCRRDVCRESGVEARPRPSDDDGACDDGLDDAADPGCARRIVHRADDDDRPAVRRRVLHDLACEPHDAPSVDHCA